MCATTYRSYSARRRDCADGARGLPEGVAKHIIRRGISNPLKKKEKKVSIATGIAIEKKRRGDGRGWWWWWICLVRQIWEGKVKRCFFSDGDFFSKEPWKLRAGERLNRQI